MKAKEIRIKATFAAANKIPTSVTASVLKETERAYYLYGHGIKAADGTCMKCGRRLTHPGSIIIGIGPECLGNWDMRDIVLDHLTDDDIKRIKAAAEERKIDQWVPKSCIKIVGDSEEELNPPTDHPMFSTVPAREPVVTPRRANLGGKSIQIRFPFSYADVTLVKQIPGRKYNPTSKDWTCPVSIEAITALEEAGFYVDPELIALRDATTGSVNDVGTVSIPGLEKKLYPFQQKGVAFIEAKGGRVLIGDEMGLGKTVQALAWLRLHPELRPAVVVCPASLKYNWEHECHSWLNNPSVQILSGTSPYRLAPGNDVIIINYDILPYWVDALDDANPKVAILDECHYIKSNKAKRTKATKQFVKNIDHVIALSGTPAVNRPVELFNALKIVNATVVPDFWDFVQKYCDAKHGRFGWDFSGASNTAALHELLTNTIMIRRLKSEVLTELPDKIRSIIPMDITNRPQYEAAEDNFINWIRTNKGTEAAKAASKAEQLVQAEALKQLAVQGKLGQVTEWIENHIDNDGKLVVFATHKETIDHLMKAFGSRAVKIDGSVALADRDIAVNAFQNDDSIRLFVGNIKAAGVGLTLTAASSVAFVELPWTPGDLVQAEDRCHRIGQKNAVNIYYLVAQHTIDEQVASLLDSKRRVLSAILDGRAPEQMSLLSELINAYIEEERND